MITLLIAVITTYLLGMYFLYRHWRNTPPDAFLKRRTAIPVSERKGTLRIRHGAFEEALRRI